MPEDDVPRSHSDFRRWDTDTRGSGIGDGGWIAPAVQGLLAELSVAGWIAEEPETHLHPHLQGACAAPGSPWTLISAEIHGAVYEVTATWARPGASLRQLRTDAFALIGTVAESSTFIRQVLVDEDVVFEATTGMLAGDSPFAPHGHLLLLRVRPLDSGIL